MSALKHWLLLTVGTSLLLLGSHIIFTYYFEQVNQNPQIHSLESAPSNLQKESYQVITIAVMGDYLFSREQQVFALEKNNGYKAIWQNLIPVLTNSSAADITYANYEGPSANVYRYKNGTCIAVNYTNKTFGHLYRSWDWGKTDCIFNYHPSLAMDVKSSHIDIVSTANNHALDVCKVGLFQTMEALEKNNVLYIGTKRDMNAEWYTMTKVKGFNIAWVACTEWTQGDKNTHRYPENILYCHDDTFIKTIEQLHNMPSVDGIIACIHGGEEYWYAIHPNMQKFVFAAIKAGASLILGNHAHVSQPIETFYMHNRTNVVVWSLGNFVTRQGYSGSINERRDIRRRSGGIIYFDMIVTEFGLDFQCYHYVPVCTLCKENEDESIEFWVENALNKSECMYEKEWMEHVWGVEPTKCRYVTTSKQLRTEVNFRKRKHKPFNDESGNIGTGFCTRNVKYSKYRNNPASSFLLRS